MLLRKLVFILSITLANQENGNVMGRSDLKFSVVWWAVPGKPQTGFSLLKCGNIYFNLFPCLRDEARMVLSKPDSHAIHPNNNSCISNARA